MIRQLALLGLPHAGKTAWLGRLWVGADTRVGRLHRAATPGDVGALNQLSDWLYEARYPDRSPAENAPDFHADLVWDGRSGRLPFTLHISDYSGEELNAIYKDRAAWKEGWDARARASGLAILVRPDQLNPPRASRLRRSAPTSDEAERLLGAAMMPDRDLRQDDLVDRLPTGTALVEMLQLLRAARRLSTGEVPDPDDWRIAVIFSAWDAVPSEEREAGPTAFLRGKLGLLDDFLATNYDPRGVRVFGLSTTGGDLNDPSFATQYKEKDPEHFGFVCWDTSDGPRQESDVTLPLGWLLEGDAALP